ncbi:unnamed protein product [Moneuplotes crassus]|uniref:FHA domain-containing protein n=1 Tax=Euplotes crassus TaxID=5936 RepID=A0AAD1XBX9_EUPCR|nr:unnamed protein product [Moneuplotes crassus]
MRKKTMRSKSYVCPLKAYHKNIRLLEESKISEKLKDEIKQDLLEAERLIQVMRNNKSMFKFLDGIKNLLPKSNLEQIKEINESLQDKIQLVLFEFQIQNEIGGKRRRKWDSSPNWDKTSVKKKYVPVIGSSIFLDPTLQRNDDLFAKSTYNTVDNLKPQLLYTLEFLKNESNVKYLDENKKYKEILNKKVNKEPVKEISIGRIDFKDIFPKDILIRISKVQFKIQFKKIEEPKKEKDEKQVRKDSENSDDDLDDVLQKIETMSLEKGEEAKLDPKKTSSDLPRISINKTSEKGSPQKERKISQKSQEDSEDEIFLTAVNCTTELRKRQENSYVFTILDQSSNGTYINGNLIGKGNSKELVDGDKIRFADTDDSDKKYCCYKFKVV